MYIEKIIKVEDWQRRQCVDTRCAGETTRKPASPCSHGGPALTDEHDRQPASLRNNAGGRRSISRCFPLSPFPGDNDTMADPRFW